MPQGATHRVTGLNEWITACDNAGKETKYRVRATFRKVGEPVKVDATARFMPISVRSASRFRTVVRRRGISVEQSLPRSGNPLRRRPKYAELQMDRALEPALEQNEDRTVREFERAMDIVCDHLERSP